MRKIFTSAFCCLFAASMCAQVLNKVTANDGTALQVLNISNNGKYICGYVPDYMLPFISDWQNNNTEIFGESEDGGEMRWVTDNGVGCGFERGGIKCDFNTASLVYVQPTVDDPYMDAICEAMTEDGTMIVGSTYGTMSFDGSSQRPVLWKDGVENVLPFPTSEEIGFNIMGATAKLISADGSVIVGHVVDDMASYPMILWTRQDDGTYVCDPVCKGLFQPGGWDDEKDEPITGDNPYLTFTPLAISPDGKKITLGIVENLGEWGTENKIGIYDVATKHLEVITVDGEHGIELETPCSAVGIANDGTIVGYAGTLFGRYGFILKAGEKQPKLLADVFSDLTELAGYDEIGVHLAVAISADGRYITGFGISMEIGDYETYVIDTKGAPAGISTVTGNKKQAVEYYTVDGRKASAPVRGLNVVKTADGQTKKIIVNK